jgi:hypothetical protein
MICTLSTPVVVSSRRGRMTRHPRRRSKRSRRRRRRRKTQSGGGEDGTAKRAKHPSVTIGHAVTVDFTGRIEGWC